jgi:hypothetical protein
MRLLVVIILFWHAGEASAAPRQNKPAVFSAEAVNAATFSAKAKPDTGFSPVTLKAQVLLDRARFSPGVIDARGGENFKKAVSAYARSLGLTSSGELTAEIWARLAEDRDPVLQEYTITDTDLRGPFVVLQRDVRRAVPYGSSPSEGTLTQVRRSTTREHLFWLQTSPLTLAGRPILASVGSPLIRNWASSEPLQRRGSSWPFILPPSAALSRRRPWARTRFKQ